MTNKEIAKTFQELADIMELHQENPFKIRTYQNAYIALRKIQTPLAEMPVAELIAVKGIGKAVSDKVQELIQTGQMEALRHYHQITPPGVVEMLKVKGFGPKKVLTVWKELDIDSIGELIYACNENRLTELYGFGKKTQDELRKSLEYYQRSKNKWLYPEAVQAIQDLLIFLKERLNHIRIEAVGELRRCCPVISRLECLIGADIPFDSIFPLSDFSIVRQQDNECIVRTPDDAMVHLYKCAPAEWGSKLFKYTGSPEFLREFVQSGGDKDFRRLSEEQEVFETAGYRYIPPECREAGARFVPSGSASAYDELLQDADIKGVVHAHSTYSDGIHSLPEMARQAERLGYGYLVISDHSKSAFYANGLREDRLLAQWKEIEEWNDRSPSFRIFKSIESDILNDGSLDYHDAILDQFDCVIASVHSQLRMTEEKATERLIKAIENPYTTILGHPTGRLLLSREGYPLDHRKVIDACALHGVAIELNANPYRLDLDYQWIPYAMEKGVMICVNPDAHSKEGIGDIRYGVLAARKGGLTRSACLNSLSKEDFEQWISQKKRRSADIIS